MKGKWWGYNWSPIVDAIIEDRRPNTHEKGNEIASAPDCKSVTCSNERQCYKRNGKRSTVEHSNALVNEVSKGHKPEVVPRNRSTQAC